MITSCSEDNKTGQSKTPRYERGYGYMFSKHIEQAPEGCDFDFLKTDYGAPVNEPDIFKNLVGQTVLNNLITFARTDVLRLH